MKPINEEIIEEIKKANFVYIIGNGGSASTANHFANDLVKMAGIKAISLCANEAVVMAYANDSGYENIFSEQLQVFAKPGDLLITISGSGKSPNILKAQEYALRWGIPIYQFPTMEKLECDMQRAEDRHLALAHEIAESIRS
jgi:D-sedoheptulose 7-phosphate isomerase